MQTLRNIREELHGPRQHLDHHDGGEDVGHGDGFVAQGHGYCEEEGSG